MLQETYHYHDCGNMRSPSPKLVSDYVFFTACVRFTHVVHHNSLVWPFVARHMVRKSIAGCMDQLEDYYTFVMGSYLYHDPTSMPSDTDITKGEKIESKIQSAIDACSVLLELTDHEPRFRGPFPKLFYKEMIVSMRNILDRLLSMRIALLQMPLVVKHDICAKEYHVERREMVGFFPVCGQSNMDD